jgi:aminoglycoside phosphotransferase (APT) family kinase protein
MTAFEIALPSGQARKLILRLPCEQLQQSDPRAAVEFRLLEILRTAGVAAPKPCYLDETGELFPRPYLVTEYIEGEPKYTATDLSAAVRQMAVQMASIHTLDTSRIDLSFLQGHPTELDARPPVVDDSMDEGRIRDVLESAWPLPGSVRSVLLHGDFWPGNLLWRDGKLVAVIDWEDAKLGDPLEDLAICRFDTLFIFGAAAMHGLAEHYRSLTGADLAALPYWDLYAALRPIGHLSEWAPGWTEMGRPDIDEGAIRAAHRLFVNQALERLGV